MEGMARRAESMVERPDLYDIRPDTSRPIDLYDRTTRNVRSQREFVEVKSDSAIPSRN